MTYNEVTVVPTQNAWQHGIKNQVLSCNFFTPQVLNPMLFAASFIPSNDIPSRVMKHFVLKSVKRVMITIVL